MKSVAQPSSKPFASPTSAAEATNTAPRTINSTSGINDTRGVYNPASVPGISPIYPPRYTPAPQNTFLTRGPSVQAHPPQYSLSPSMSPPWKDAYPQRQGGEFWGSSPNASATSLAGPYAPKTAGELGLLDRPDTSYEGMEMSNIVERMTAAFPLDFHSGI